MEEETEMEIYDEKVVICRCPFCDTSANPPDPFCIACGAKLLYCEKCKQPMPLQAETCPNCGEPGSKEKRK